MEGDPPPAVMGAGGSGQGAGIGGGRCAGYAIAVGSVAMVVFFLSAAPEVVWGDSAKLTLLALDLEMGPSPGAHPGYVLVAGLLVRLVSLDPARVLNLASALFGAGVIAVIYALGCRIWGRTAGLGAAASLTVAHLFWNSASIAETYTLAALSLALVFLGAARYSVLPSFAVLAGIGFAVGFGTSVNAVVGLLSPAALVLLWKGRNETRWWWIPLGLVMFAAGLTPYLLGAWMRQRQFMIYSVGLIFPALFAGFGLAWVGRRMTSTGWLTPLLLALIVVTPVVTYLVIPPVAEALGIELTGARTVPHRDQAYFLRPWKTGYRGADRFASEVFAEAGPGDRVVADFTLNRVLAYYQERGRGRGVELIGADRFIFAHDPEGLAEVIRSSLEGGSRVFLADDEPDYYFVGYLRERFRLSRTGVLTEVQW